MSHQPFEMSGDLLTKCKNATTLNLNSYCPFILVSIHIIAILPLNDIHHYFNDIHSNLIGRWGLIVRGCGLSLI